MTTSSNPVSDRAAQQTLQFLQSFTQNPTSSFISLERQIGVLLTAKEKAQAKKRKIKSTIKAKTIELHTTLEEVMEIDQKIKRLKRMQEPPDSDDENHLR